MTPRIRSTHSLVRLRVGARAVLALGIGASLAANVLAAEPSGVGRVIAAWSPVSLLLTVELISRVPVAGGWLSAVRIAATATIAGIAAWVSYWHMVEVTLAHGEAPVAAHLLPISVDGLVIVASVCMKEISRRFETTGAVADAPPATHEPTSATRGRRSPGARSGRERIRDLANEHPDWTQARIAREVGCSDRTVRRHLASDPERRTTEEVPA